MPLLLSQQVMRAMQLPKRLVGCIEVSGRRRADSFSIKSDSYNLSVSKKKREEYCRALPQKCRASRLIRSTGLASLARRGPHRGLDFPAAGPPTDSVLPLPANRHRGGFFSVHMQ
jgi:hypothetical protein